MHENHALPSFRHIMASIDEKNCHAIFTFSGLVLHYPLAAAQESFELDQGQSGEELPKMDASPSRHSYPPVFELGLAFERTIQACPRAHQVSY